MKYINHEQSACSPFELLQKVTEAEFINETKYYRIRLGNGSLIWNGGEIDLGISFWKSSYIFTFCLGISWGSKYILTCT